MIRVSTAEFARTNKGLLRLLKAVEKAGDDGIATRNLLNDIHMTGYGQTLIRRAEERGFIKREERPPEKGRKGAWLKVNILTKKGKQLLQKLNEEE